MQKKYSTTKNSIASDYCGNQCRGCNILLLSENPQIKILRRNGQTVVNV